MYPGHFIQMELNKTWLLWLASFTTTLLSRLVSAVAWITGPHPGHQEHSGWWTSLSLWFLEPPLSHSSCSAGDRSHSPSCPLLIVCALNVGEPQGSGIRPLVFFTLIPEGPSTSLMGFHPMCICHQLPNMYPQPRPLFFISSWTSICIAETTHPKRTLELSNLFLS